MPDINKDIERILHSDNIDSSDLARIVNELRDEGRYDMIDRLTKDLLQHHYSDDILLLRAWYLINIEEEYYESYDILRTIGESDKVMYPLLHATIVLRSSFDADKADDILQMFADGHPTMLMSLCIEAARLFVSSGFTDLAEKWLSMYQGVHNSDYMMVYGDILVAREQAADAIDVFEGITTTDNNNAEAWLKLSDALISIKDYERAITAAQHALDNNSYERKALENIRLCNICIIRHNNRIINN